ncbi:MAG: hypothetical protein ACRD2C_24165 [Acidimicrobiales bacterium]
MSIPVLRWLADRGRRWSSPWRSTPPAGWWRADDGRWYPTSLARHPAARDDVAAATVRARVADRVDRASRPAAADVTRRWTVWSVALVPLLALVVAVLGLLGSAARRDSVETDGRPGSATTASIVDSVPGQGRPATTPHSTSSTAGQPILPTPLTPPQASTASTTATVSENQAFPRPGPSTVPPVAPSSTSQPPRGTPATADDCKQGGWADLVDHQGQPFSNQGACVSYVNAHDAGASPLGAIATFRHRCVLPL